MGHLINPISTRLSFSSFWISSWTDFFLKEFSYNLMLDRGITALLDWMLIHSWFSQLLTKNGIFLSHYRLIRRGRKFRVHCFLIYNSSTLLNSSFVELNPNVIGIEWPELWSKKHLISKNRFLIKSIQKSIALNLNTNLALKLTKKLSLLNTLGVISKKGQSSSRARPRFGGRSKESVGLTYSSSNRYLLRLRKTKLTRLLEFLNYYFSFFFSSLLTNFSKKVESLRNSSISFGIRFLDNFSLINPQFIARFIARRISYGFQLQRVIKPLIKDLLVSISKKKNKIIGFRIACSGRFDRKQIASYVWQKFGPVSLNKFSSSINYGFATAFLKYGSCGIKVWIASKHQPIRSQFKNRTSLSFFFKKLTTLSSINSGVLLACEGLKRLVCAFNLFNCFFEFKNKTNFLNSLIDRSFLLAVGSNQFLRFQLLLATWLRRENRFIKKLK